MLTDDVRRTAEACLYFKLTGEPKGSGELNMACIDDVLNIL